MSRPLLYDANGDVLIETPEPLPDGSGQVFASIPEDFDPDDGQPGVSCQLCGCTDMDGCSPNGCFWVAPALCSACCQPLAEAWLVTPDLVRTVAADVRRELAS